MAWYRQCLCYLWLYRISMNVWLHLKFVTPFNKMSVICLKTHKFVKPVAFLLDAELVWCMLTGTEEVLNYTLNIRVQIFVTWYVYDISSWYNSHQNCNFTPVREYASWVCFYFSSSWSIGSSESSREISDLLKRFFFINN